eukprot:TRINITY_DN2746_c0_g2_i3.p1 TRINITY_DN2746_c0_g2~~TRINITY_DN2746_c0_g2_i3.p1  ORF type:complete len:204 (-),score=29.57 TRINITY_DN2746_c0_g2_i3:253-864(-)
MAENFEAYKKVLQTLENDSLQKKDTEYIGKAMDKLETCFMTVFWNTILKRTNQTSKMLQSETIDLCTAVALLQSLYQYFAEQRSQEKFAHFFARGKMLCGATGFSEKRLRRSKRTPDDTSDTGIVFNAEDRIGFKHTSQSWALMNDLNRRIEAHSSTENRFVFLRDSSESESLRKLTNFYSVDWILLKRLLKNGIDGDLSLIN